MHDSYKSLFLRILAGATAFLVAFYLIAAAISYVCAIKENKAAAERRAGDTQIIIVDAPSFSQALPLGARKAYYTGGGGHVTLSARGGRTNVGEFEKGAETSSPVTVWDNFVDSLIARFTRSNTVSSSGQVIYYSDTDLKTLYSDYGSSDGSLLLKASNGEVTPKDNSIIAASLSSNIAYLGDSSYFSADPMSAASQLSRTNGLSLASASSGKIILPYSDLGRHWARMMLATAYNETILAGFADGTLFQPDAFLTGEKELIVLRNIGIEAPFIDLKSYIRRGAALKPFAASFKDAIAAQSTDDINITLSAFSDSSSIEVNMRPLIAFAVKEGWIQGYGNGCLGANDPITRAEYILAVSRMLTSKRIYK